MKKTLSLVAVAALLLGIVGATVLAADAKKAETTISGYVTDSMCKGEGAKEGHKDCAIKCATKQGAKLGVWDAASSKFYALEDQKKAMDFAGEMVTVKGTIDDATGTMKATSIAKAEKK